MKAKIEIKINTKKNIKLKEVLNELEILLNYLLTLKPEKDYTIIARK